MADRKWTIALGWVNLAASAVIATVSLMAVTRQDDLLAGQGRQGAQLGSLIEATALLATGIDSLDRRTARTLGQAGSVARP